jgi:hypothetical protein
VAAVAVVLIITLLEQVGQVVAVLEQVQLAKF